MGQSTQFKRSVAFIAALALNQAKPALTIQLLQCADFSNLTAQIKLLALADLGYANEINEALTMWINNKKFAKNKISIDVVSISKHVPIVLYQSMLLIVYFIFSLKGYSSD